MKRIIFFSLLIGLILPSISAAADFNGFFVLDQITNTVEIYDGQEKLKSFKSTPKSARVIENPDNSGYIIMYRGAKKKSGELAFLDQAFKTLTRKELPGLVVQDFYLKETGLWLLFTVNSDKENLISTLTCYDLKTKVTNNIALNGPPVVYHFNEEQTELAVGTLGNFEAKIPAQLVLIDLTQKQARNFPVSANPGAIYRTASGKIVVACGGFRNSQKYPSQILLERTPAAEFAKLHWIDPATGVTEHLQLEYSPLLISQDQKDLDTFYAVCANVYEDLNEKQRGIVIGSPNEPVSNKPKATFYKITAGKITAELKLQNQPNHLIQASTSRICLQEEKNLLIIDVSGPTLQLYEYNRDRSIDQFLINNEGTIGYLANENSNFLNIVDLKTGKEIKTIKIGNYFFIGKMVLEFFGSGLPPVTQSPSPETLATNSSAENRRMFFAKDFSRLYVLAGGPELSVVDLQTNEVKSVIRFKDTQYGIHPTPNGEYIVVTAKNGWHLIDPEASKPIFSYNFKLEENEEGPDKGYYSPNGDLLVIPFNNYLYLINPVQGSFLGKFRTKAIAPQIVWPE
ncbi:MAG: YncE family protein [Bacteroidota bacterium]